jgi:hypothetical protein
MRKITHVVFIMKENRTFDNYFDTYPDANWRLPGPCIPAWGSPRSDGPRH